MPPVDVDATVIANARWSRDYSVLSLAAPEVGRRTQPGQFVMVKPAGVTDPLLRRPFSVFEVLKNGTGDITGVSILNKRAGRSTNRLYELEEGDVVSCLGPLGVPFTPVAAPMEGWMVAGGVGLAPFATLAESLAAATHASDALLRRAHRGRAVLSRVLRAPRHHAGARHRRRRARREGPGHRAARSGAESPEDHGLGADLSAVGLPKAEASAKAAAMVYACGPEPMLEAVAKLAARYHQPSQVSVERVMGCGLGGCYSCVVPVKPTFAKATVGGHGDEHANLVRSCISGPVFDGAELVWD